MQNQLAGTKRPAPGSYPHMQIPGTSSTNMNNSNGADPSTLTNDQFLAWSLNNKNERLQQGYDGAVDFNGSQYQPAQGNEHIANQLVRRNQDQGLTTSTNDFTSMDTGSWPQTAEVGLNDPWYGDNGQLGEKAAAAKQEAQSRRPPRQIPPFIQKLSNFLDQHKNEALIRWSPSGDSFIVLDEEQFANTLIPELFKHNNYASFVRQLNMYGFHKKVGLTDNSMRASERKTKNPSEYENPYFKRGRPDLLWLIAKPKSAVSKKKKGKQGEESEEEDFDDQQQPNLTTNGNKKLDLVTLPRSQLVTFQSEIQQLKRQQQQINQMISQFRHENSQYVKHATRQHERHENSINAILQFLATFYSRNADGSGNIPNMFPGANLTNAQPAGNVQEMNEYEDDQDQSPNQPRRQTRRPLALLPAPQIEEEKRSETPDAAATRPVSSQDQQTLRPQNATGNSKGLQVPQASSALRNSVDPISPVAPSTPDTEMQREHATPRVQSATPQPQQAATNQQPHDTSLGQHPASGNLQRTSSEIMQFINNSNASTPPLDNLDFSSALKNYENASPNGPLTAEQRNNVLNMMASNSGAGTPLNNMMLTNANNAQQQNDFLQQYANNQKQLDLLQKLQQEQDNRVSDLAGRLQPLSPHGSIPGLEGFNNVGNGNATLGAMNTLPDNFSLDDTFQGNENFDISNWLNSDYVDDGAGGNLGLGDNPALNFNESADNYFPNVNFDGASQPTASGLNNESTQTGAGANDLFNTNAGADGMFGGIDGAADDDQGLHPKSADPANGEEDGEGGKVIGSVGTSSAGRSPHLQDVDAPSEDEGQPKKKQRVT